MSAHHKFPFRWSDAVECDAWYEHNALMCELIGRQGTFTLSHTHAYTQNTQSAVFALKLIKFWNSVARTSPKSVTIFSV